MLPCQHPAEGFVHQRSKRKDAAARRGSRAGSEATPAKRTSRCAAHLTPCIDVTGLSRNARAAPAAASAAAPAAPRRALPASPGFRAAPPGFRPMVCAAPPASWPGCCRKARRRTKSPARWLERPPGRALSRCLGEEQTMYA